MKAKSIRRFPLIAMSGLIVTATLVMPLQSATASPSINRCTNHQLKASYRGGSGAAGTIFGRIVLKNISSRRCYIKGFGKLMYVSGRIGDQVGHGATRDTATPVTKVILGSGDKAKSQIAETQAGNYPAHKCRPVSVPGMDVWIPGGSGIQFLRHPTTACKNKHVHLLSHRAYK